MDVKNSAPILIMQIVWRYISSARLLLLSIFKVSCKENCSHFLLFWGKLFIEFKISIFCQSLLQWECGSWLFSDRQLQPSYKMCKIFILRFPPQIVQQLDMKGRRVYRLDWDNVLTVSNPSAMISVEVKHEITIRIILELVIIASPAPTCPGHWTLLLLLE